jgi:tetratricopeptide (TPR) repeat protein
MHDLKQRADLNGCVAVVKNAAEFFECNGRLEVSAGAVGKRELLKLKPSNLRLEWHVAAEVHATCVASVVTVSSLGSELRGRTCRVLSYDDATQSVALHVEGQEPGAAGPADSVRVPVSDVVPASYSDIAKELHGCAMKAIMRSWTDRHTPCVSAACLAVQSCAAFYIRSSLDDEAARVCVTFLKLLYSGGRKESKDTLRDAELRMVWVGSFIMVCSNVLYCNFFHSCCYAAAITVLQQCKLIIDQTEGILNENMAAIHHNIAQCHERLDQYDDAESEYNNALRIGLLLEPCGEAVAQVCCGLGALHDKQNRLNDAADAYQQALVRYKQLRGWESPGVAQVLSCSARVFERQDKLDEAKTAYEEALRIKVLLIGYESLDVAEILNNVAGLYQKLHRLDDAASSLLEALRIRKSQLGNENLPVADTLSDLAQVRELQSQLEEAEALHTEVTPLTPHFTPLTPHFTPLTPHFTPLTHH